MSSPPPALPAPPKAPNAISKAKENCTLEPINLHCATQFTELQRQRVLCGWHNETAALESWRAAMDFGTKVLFWIVPIPSGDGDRKDSATTTTTTTRTQVGRADSDSDSTPRAGHISLESASIYNDPELCNPDKSILCISSLFILPAFRSRGYARSAVRILESWARTPPYGSPNCRAVTVSTISRRYIEDDGPQWRGMYARMGREAPPKGGSNEDW
jgi:GNAT superfamily N-acetyltransferase